MPLGHVGVTTERYPLRSRILSVVGVEELSPAMRRIVLGGDECLPTGTFSPTDHVKLVLPDATGSIHLPVITETGIKREPGVALREYTIRSFDPATGELAIDFVLHDHGPAGRWAIAAAPGHRIGVMGPRGSAIFPDTYSRFVLAADETALPAAERWLEQAPAAARLDLYISIATAADERTLPAHPGATVTWLHRDAGEQLADAVIAALPAAGPDTFVWAAAEASSLLPLRRWVREVGVDKQALDIRGYWKQGEAEHKEAHTHGE